MTQLVTLPRSLFLFWCFFFSSHFLFAQLNDNFNDGDYTTGPATWSGGNTVTAGDGFTVNGANQLQTDLPSGSSGTRRAYLSTALPALLDLTTGNYEWEFDITLDFTSPNPPNGTNHARIFLVSDQSDLLGNLNGYYLRIEDQVMLYAQSGGTSSQIPLGGGITTFLNSPVSGTVRVVRTSAGLWMVYFNGNLEGYATDLTHTASSFFGVQYRYSANSRRNDFIFDNVRLTPYIDATAPTPLAVFGAAPTQIEVDFDELLDPTTAENPANYSVSGGMGVPTSAALNPADGSRVRLTFAGTFTPSATYTLTVSGVEDLFGNAVAPPANLPFTFTDALPPQLLKIIVTSSNALDVRFTEPLENTSASNVNNYVKSSGVPNPISAVQDGADPALVHLFFSDNFPANSLETLTVNNLADPQGNTMTAAESLPFEYDDQSPTICTSGCVIALSANQLLVQFSENVDLTTAQIVNNYEVIGYGNPINAVRNPANPSQVTLTFGGPGFTPQIEYRLRTRDVEDLVGNVMGTRTRDFVYDLLAPSVVDLRVMDNNTLQLTFSEIVDQTSAENVANYVVSGGFGIPTSATRFAGDARIVTLFYAGGLGNVAGLTLTVSNVQDLVGNPVIPPQILNFSTLSPTIAQLDVLSETRLRVQFSEDVNAATAGNAANYTVAGIGTASGVTILAPNLVELDFSTAFQAGTVYTLNVNNVEDLTANAMTNESEDFEYRTFVTQVLLVSPTLLDVYFEEPVAAAGAAVVLYQVNNGVGNPISAVVDAADPRIVHLSFANPFPPNTVHTLTLGPIPFQNNRIAPISEHDFQLDDQAPQVLEVLVMTDSTVVVVFNENVEQVTAEALNHYFVNAGIGNPTQTNLLGDRVEMLFSGQVFNFGTTYTMTVESIRDLAGNQLISQTINFSRPAPPTAGSLLITEIMADPDPVQGLPSSEYLEIYNTTNQTWDLLGVELYDGTGQTRLQPQLIGPGEYLVLCSPPAFDSLQAFVPNLFVVTPWRSLNNSGEILTLVSPDGTVIDRVGYDDSWYRDPVKNNGGWSLERIDLTSPCNGYRNWKASQDSIGGTPGEVNSVNGVVSDSLPPKISFIELVTPDTLEVFFTEDPDSLAMTDPANYSLDNGLSVTGTRFMGFTHVRLGLSAALDSTVLYNLIINNINDCAGNVFPDTAQIGIGTKPAKYELLITEIMADPDPAVGLPNTEYIEIYNRASSLRNLGGVAIMDGTSFRNLPNTFIGSNEYLILCTSSRVDSFANRAVAVTSFPGLANTGEELSLRDTSGALIFRVEYDDDWYGAPTKSDGGWSLEMVDMSNFCGEADNWRASENPAGGTPGAGNSVSASNPDNTLPEIVHIEVLSDVLLRIDFSEIMDSLRIVQQSNYTLSGIGIASVEFVNYKSVKLHLSTPLNPSRIYTLSVSGLNDCVNNTLSGSFEFGQGRAPELYELLITEIMADPDPQVGLPSVEYVEILNTTDELIGLSGVKLYDATGDATLPDVALEAGEYVILCSTSKVDSFPQARAIGVSGFPSLNNGGERLELRNHREELVHVVEYDDGWYRDARKAGGGWSLELIDIQSPCVQAPNWTASRDTLGGTPGFPNSVAASNPDTLSPSLVGLRLLNPNTLEVRFSESMDSASITEITAYSIDNGLGISQILWQDEKTVWVEFSPQAQENTLYTLTLSGTQQDCSGNLLGEQRGNFGIGVMPEYHELLITEIMADPTPVVGLPEREYLELFNNSDKLLSLGQVVLYDEGDAVRLPDVVMLPGEYLTLGSSSAATELAQFGRTVAVSGFPSLSNFGEELRLRNATGALLFEVFYDDDWYQDEVKEDGGWSLEMIDPANPCAESENWRASTSPFGGTPSTQNSVFGANPDTSIPEVSLLNVRDARTLELQFSENMDSLSLMNLSNYSLTGGLQVDSLTYLSRKKLLLHISPPLTINVSYSLRCEGATDCVGNEILNRPVNFGLGATPEYHELLITEIMADPSPVVNLPESEYLELYNPTDKILSLNGLLFSDERETVQLPARTMQPGTRLVLCPNSVQSQFEPFGETLGLSNWLSLTNAGEKLSIRKPDGSLIFEVNYQDDWYESSEKKEGGWSLEMIDPSNPCAEEGNWAESEAPRGGTPAAINSVNGSNPDNFGPQLLRADALSSTEVLLRFDEKLDSVQTVQFAQFDLSNGLQVSAVRLLEGYTQVLLQVSPALQPRTEYRVTLSELTDCNGNFIRDEANSATFILPEQGDSLDIILNEVLANPPVGGVDFVELYNTSGKFINLQGWQLATLREGALYTPRVIAEDILILAPGEYLAVSKDSEQLKNQYPNGAFERFHQAGNIPSYADAEGVVVLLDSSSREMDKFEYDRDMHFDLIRDQNNVSLERISFTAPTNDPNNWHSASSEVGYGTPGYLNSQHEANPRSEQLKDCFSLTREIFTPDGDGIEDFTQLNYECLDAGTASRVRIFDVRGRLIRDLAPDGYLLSTQGSLKWDGLQDNGQKARVGHYLIVIELFDLDGNAQTVVKKVVVGARL